MSDRPASGPGVVRRLVAAAARPLFRAACAVGRPFGGIRPRRVYDWLGRLAYPVPEFEWRRNRWGDELYLSPHYHIDRNILIFGTYDADLHQAIENLVRPGMVCLDVGANLGEVALHVARRVGPGGQVHAFEPAPPIYERLRLHVGHNHLQDVVHTHPIALSDQTGPCTIAFPGADQDNQGLGSIVNLGPKSGAARATASAMTLDDFVAEHGLTRLDLMKVDIQGGEPALLRGGRRTFAELGPDLLMEVSPEDLRAAGSDSRELCRMLDEYGYRIHHLTGGRVGRRIHASEVTPAFAATNVYCTRAADRRSL
jgi:FkbM family methyltransferase